MESRASAMFWIYQWQSNTDSSHSPEHYRLQLFVTVGFLLDDPSGIWKVGSNAVAAIMSCLGWRILRWALLWTFPVKRSCVLGPWGFSFSSLMTAWMPEDPEMELLESAGQCQGKESGREAPCSIFSIRAACLLRITLISLPFPIASWVIARFFSVSSPLVESCSLPVPGLYFHMFWKVESSPIISSPSDFARHFDKGNASESHFV